MDLDAIAIFTKVIQSGSFTEAAKILGMPKSTVSAKVSELEKSLGVTLLHRTTRKLNLTEAGETYFEKCVRALAELEEARAEISTKQAGPRGLLKITAPVDAGYSLLPEIVDRYLERYPDVQVEMIVTNRVVNLVAEGIDLALRAGKLDDSSLKAKKVLEIHLGFWASPTYLKEHSTPKKPEDLTSHELIIFKSMVGKPVKLTDGKSTREFKIQGRVCGDDFSTLKRLALLDYGIVSLPNFLCEKEIKSGRLVRVLPQWRWGESAFHLVYPAQKFVSPKIQAFVKLTDEFFKSTASTET